MKGLNSANPVVLWMGILMLLACSGCDDAVGPCQQSVASGRIQGRVRSGGLAVHAIVKAIPIVDGVEEDSVFRAEVGEEGYYSLDAPKGMYVVRLDMDSSSAYYDYPDTLLVDCSNPWKGIDFNLGGLTLELFISEHLDGKAGAVVLHRRDEIEDGSNPTYVFKEFGEISNGHLYIYMPCVLPGEYQVEVILGLESWYYFYAKTDSGEHFWLPASRDQEAGQWYEVAPNSISSLSGEFDQEPARIEGTIGGAWLEFGLDQRPEYFLVSPDSVVIMSERTVDRDGHYAVDLYFPSPMKLLVSHYGIDQWIGGRNFEDATIFDLNLGETISGVDLLQSGLHLSFVAPESHVGQTYIKIYDSISNEILYVINKYLFSDQTIVVPNLVSGSYLMQVSPAIQTWNSMSWRPQWFDRVVEPQLAQPILIASPGTIVDLEIILEVGGVISGNILHGPDQTSYYYTIAVSTDGLEVIKYDDTYFPEDAFLLDGLPDGEFYIGTFTGGWNWDWNDPPPANTIWYPGTKDIDLAEVVEILDASVMTGLDIDIR